MDRGAWKATVYGAAKDRTWLRDPAHIYVYETSHKISSLPGNAAEIYQARKTNRQTLLSLYHSSEHDCTYFSM